MKYGSVCSGVEAATVAWHPFGWQAQWFSEIKKFPSAVLQHHYPHELFAYNRTLDSTFKLDLSFLSDLRKKPDYLLIYDDNEKFYEKDRNIIMHSLKFNSAGSKAVFDVRSYDNKDRWIIVLDLETMILKEINHQHDEAWIGGPGISSWNMVEGTLGWLDNETMFYQSEE
ncbi:MAG: hypothetical protein ACPG8Y_06280, partial [Paracoccaceae bacterium]